MEKQKQDFTKDSIFWQRLKNFIENTQVNCQCDEKEKQMILHNCNLKLKKHFTYCQRNEEGESKCEIQCDHCKEYYKPLENND